jgi:fructuronate reductase
MRYACGVDEKGNAIDVRDPLADRIAERMRPLREPGEIVRAYLGFKEVFGDDLAGDVEFARTVTRKLAGLLADGAAATVGRQ